MNARSNARSIAKTDASEQCTYGRTYGRTYVDGLSPSRDISRFVTRALAYGDFVDG